MVLRHTEATVRMTLAGCIVLVTFFAPLVAASTAVAQSSGEQQRALEIIEQFIGKVCQRPTGGSRTTIGGNVQIDAELKGLTRLLVNVGGQIGAQAQKVSWDGVAQDQIAQAMAAGNNCSVQITALLFPRFFPETSPGPSSKPPAASQSKSAGPQYAARRSYGFLQWRNGLHPTAETCVASISPSDLISRTTDCRRVPERLVCSYESYNRGALFPICYWTAEDCETDYRLITARLAKRPPDVWPIARVGCEDVERTKAVAQYEAWEYSYDVAQRLRPPVFSTIWRGSRTD